MWHPKTETKDAGEIVTEMVEWWQLNQFSPRSALAALGFSSENKDYDYLSWLDLTRIARTTYIEMVAAD